jgi:protein tyrosine/serine phosphatase
MENVMLKVEHNANWILPSGVVNPAVALCPKIKIASVFDRVINCQLAEDVAVGVVVVFAATVTFGAIGLAAVPLVIAGLALRIIYNKQMRYEASIIPTALQKSTNTLGNEIIPNCLSLGPIPLKNKFDHYKLLDAGITFILTMLEDFEWESPSLFSEPMTPEDWRQLADHHLNDIEQKIIRTADFNPVALDDLKEAVESIRKEIQDNHGHVYVHCKAGRGRSATAVICYLLMYGNSYHKIYQDLSEVDEVIAYVKSKRPQININKRQYQAIVNFYNQMYAPPANMI